MMSVLYNKQNYKLTYLFRVAQPFVDTRFWNCRTYKH